MNKFVKSIVFVCASAVLSLGQVVTNPGGTGIIPGGQNGIVYQTGSGGGFQATATGGAGTLCLLSVSGGVPAWGSCAGSASTLWSALTNPTGNLSLNMGTFTTLWTVAGNTGASNLFSIIDTTGNTGTGSLLEINTTGTSSANPFTVTAKGTANGVQVSNAGVLAPIGTGAINANELNGTLLSGLATGLLKNTTTTGVPSIAAAGTDYAAATNGTSAQVLTSNGAGGFGTALSLGSGVATALAAAVSGTGSICLSVGSACASSSGTVTNFSSGALSPLFTTSVATSTTTPALTFSLSSFSADNIFGNFSGSSGAPSTQAIPSCANDGAHALVYPSHILTCESVTGGGGGASAAINLTDFNVTASGAVLTVTLPTGGTNYGATGVVSNPGAIVATATGSGSWVASTSGYWISWDIENQRFQIDTASGISGLSFSNLTQGSTTAVGFPGNCFVPYANGTAGTVANTWSSVVTNDLPFTGASTCLKVGGGLGQTVDTKGVMTVTGGGGGAVVPKSASYGFTSIDSGTFFPFNGSSLTGTLPSTVPSMPWVLSPFNLNSTGLVINRNGNTINGGTSNITWPQYQGGTCAADTVTGGNYLCQVPFLAGTNITLTAATNGITISSSAGGGTVTSVICGTGLSGGTITTTGTCAVTGAAGEILAGATPALTATPVLGVASTTTGTLGLLNASNAFTFTLGAAAAMSASNTIVGPVSVPTSGHLLGCTTTSTTCVLTDSGVVAANVATASGLTANIIPKISTSPGLANSSITDNGTTVTITEPLGIGSSPPTVTGSGIIGLGESTGQGCASAADCFLANSTAHQMLLSNNNATAVPVAVTPATTTANNIPVYSGTAGSTLGTGITPGAGVATFLATPSGANFNSMIASGGIPINCSGTCVKSAAYTTVLGDGGGTIVHSASDNNARTFTIDSNANVAFPLYTTIVFMNLDNTVTIAITSDTLTLAGTASTGSRTLAVNGVATAVKIGTTSWLISGPGLN